MTPQIPCPCADPTAAVLVACIVLVSLNFDAQKIEGLLVWVQENKQQGSLVFLVSWRCGAGCRALDRPAWPARCCLHAGAPKHGQRSAALPCGSPAIPASPVLVCVLESPATRDWQDSRARQWAAQFLDRRR